MSDDDRSKIPDLIKIGSTQSDMSMEVDSDILDPVVSSDNFCRFVLNNKGFLHSFSAISIGLKATTATESFLPYGIGVMALIERCALRVGQTTIAEIQDFGSYMAYRSVFNDTDTNIERETYLTSRGLAYDFNYLNGSGAKYSDVNASNFYLKTRREVDNVADIPKLYTGDGEANVLPLDELDTSVGSEFRIQLSQLFPFLQTNQLPLFMIDQQVSIELFFTPKASKKRVIESTDNGADVAEIDFNNIRMIADYIYYDGDIMEQYRNANRVMSFNYVDYRLNKRTLISTASNTTTFVGKKQILDVGGAGRIVSKVISGLYEDGMTDPNVSVLNVFQARCPKTINNNNQRVITNLRYNDHYLYPLDRDNYAIHFNDVIQSSGDVPHLPRQVYSNEGQGSLSEGAGSVAFNDQILGDQDGTGLSGGLFFNCYRPNRNERINSRGIELEITYGGTTDFNAFDARNYTHKTWLEILRTATLDNGTFSQDFA
tara:strand:- start:800 stop:2260 length:1461 start_codon:yes stop_codon:yes gene_type:complete